MKKWTFSLVASVMAIPFFAYGQMDPSAFSFYNEGTSPRTDHYIIKKKKAKKHKRTIASEQKAIPLPTPIPTPTPLSEVNNGTFSVPRLPQKGTDPAPVTAPSLAKDQNDPSLPSKVRDLVLGGDLEQIENYKSFLDEQDIRKNTFDIAFSTGYLYNASSSSYFLRNYFDSSPTVGVAADIWLTPFLGIEGGYRSTLLNDIKDSPSQDNNISVTQSWLDLGLKFRRFFGLAVNSPSFAIALKYSSYQMEVPASAMSRVKVRDEMPELSLDFGIPMGKNTFGNFGLTFSPFVTESESSGATTRSGQGNQTIEIGAKVGTEYRFNRNLGAFVNLATRVFKTEFSGSASAADPITGQTPSNVPVTNIFYFIDLGIRFGQ